MAGLKALFGKLFRRRRRDDTDQEVDNKRASAVTQASQPGNGCLLHLGQPQPTTTVPAGKVRDESSSRSRKLRYGSRSLSAQVAAVKGLFQDREVAKRTPRKNQTDTESIPELPGADVPISRLESRAKQPVRQPIGIRPVLTDHSSPISTPRTSTNIGKKARTSTSADRSRPYHSRNTSSVNFQSSPHSPSILDYDERPASLSRKPKKSNLRAASKPAHGRSHSLPANEVKRTPRRHGHTSSLTNVQLNKPLPPLPLEVKRDTGKPLRSGEWPAFPGYDTLALTPSPEPPPSDMHPGYERRETPGLHPGFGDRQRTEDRTTYKRWSPSVTHETKTRLVHEIREERVTREIHNHHYYYRMLPVVDVEVLPTRHFVPAGSGFIEVDEDDISPRGSRPRRSWLSSETVAKIYAMDDEVNLSRRR